VLLLVGLLPFPCRPRWAVRPKPFHLCCCYQPRACHRWDEDESEDEGDRCGHQRSYRSRLCPAATPLVFSYHETFRVQPHRSWRAVVGMAKHMRWCRHNNTRSTGTLNWFVTEARPGPQHRGHS
jgi:hypothetical protein